MLAEKADRENYLKEKSVHYLLARLTTAVLLHRPQDPISFMITALSSGSIPDQIDAKQVHPIQINY